MPLVPAPCEDLIQILPARYRKQIMEVYESIPGTLLKFLQQQDIMKVINRSGTLFAFGRFGTEKEKTWDTFRMDLKISVQNQLDRHMVKGIEAEELSDYILTEYLTKCPNWAKPGEKLSAIVELNKTFVTECLRKIDVSMYVRITEESENNWFATNNSNYSYNLSWKLKGTLVDTARALQFCELVSENVPNAIEQIQARTPLT